MSMKLNNMTINSKTNVQSGGNNNNNESKDPDEMMLMRNNKGSFNINGKNNGKEKDYKPINSYKPTGNLVYNKELLDKIEGKFS